MTFVVNRDAFSTLTGLLCRTMRNTASPAQAALEAQTNRRSAALIAMGRTLKSLNAWLRRKFVIVPFSSYSSMQNPNPKAALSPGYPD
jgi:hypothetical protein